MRRDVTESFNPKENDWIEHKISEGYSEFSRPERKHLLLLSSIALISIITDINPEAINILGLKFENLNYFTYYSVIFAAILYKLAVFCIFIFPVRKKTHASRKKLDSEAWTLQYNKSYLDIEWNKIIMNLRYKLWLFIQFYLPLALGGIAAIGVLIKILM